MRERWKVILLVVSCFATVQLRKSHSYIPAAIEKILNADFATYIGNIDVVSCGSKLQPAINVVDRLLPNSFQSLAIRHGTCHHNQTFLNTSTLLTFDSPATFRQTEERIVWQVHPEIRNKHLVYIHNATADDIVVRHGFEIDKVAFLVNMWCLWFLQASH